MELVMAGLDHNRADIETREVFALTKELTTKTLSAMKASSIIGGCVIISTCNRTELYASTINTEHINTPEMLCNILNKDYRMYKDFFIETTNEATIERLCRVASGIDSQIMGDDQIITQVREAVDFSRSIGCTDGYVETLFKFAIQAAKDIKTQVLLRTLGLDSVPQKTVEKLVSLGQMSGRKAVVIGNGFIGRLVAEHLIGENIKVVVTLREYKYSPIKIPEKAETISYSDRYSAIEDADIVVSATSSPHYTLKYDEFCTLKRYPTHIIDLAVPRDIDPQIGNLPNTTLFTIDDITSENRIIPLDISTKIDNIVRTHINKYNNWLSYKKKVAI